MNRRQTTSGGDLMIKQPGPADRHVGARLRMQRLSKRMTQEALAEALGITFQQVQKYEKGTNRIPTSRLQHAAEVLGVPAGWFFNGIVATAEPSEQPEQAEMLTPEAIRLLNAFHAIRSSTVRKRLIELAREIAESGSAVTAPQDKTD